MINVRLLTNCSLCNLDEFEEVGYCLHYAQLINRVEGKGMAPSVPGI